MQEGLLAEATAFRDANIVDVTSYDELKRTIDDGKWARGPWAGETLLTNNHRLRQGSCTDYQCTGVSPGTMGLV